MRKRHLSLVLLAAALAACASARKGGPDVAVYEASATLPASERRLPEGCRLLGAAGPVDQMESERAADDPYRRQRRATAEKGGNVLLVLSEKTVTRPNVECPSGDTSPDCVRASKSWYRVSFEEYACSIEAVRRLAELKPEPHRGGISIPLGSSKPKEAPGPAITPAELKTKVLEMMREGVAPGVVLAWVNGQRITRKLNTEEIIDWTKSGIPDAVIQSAATR